ncbi:MAG TPA: FkbM family methyltransferase [Candidatus Paceibacterota bacterium]|nr:FkbM family methyltransferase [Candidatus Paceibacterota bacterium]HMO82767.1 FkbM family methyltransferase [Candidatus Paceibacterota bacterium]
MLREDIIKKIEAKATDADLTIIRSARFKKHPLKAFCFYLLVALNRFTPFAIPIKSQTIWGDKLQAYETSAIGSVYFLGFYDSEVTLFLLKYFKESGDLLDVGSNIGYYTSLFTQIKVPAAKITAFEPTPSTFTVLKQNTRHLPQVQLEQIALADSMGTVQFHDYGIQHGVFNSSKAQPHAFLKNVGSLIEVQTDTLDAWCEKTNTKPSLIKLDTEGTEVKILSQAGKTLANYRPIILLEVGGGEAWKDNTTGSLDLLASHGYQFFTLNQAGDPIPHMRQASYQYQNLVAIHHTELPKYVK